MDNYPFTSSTFVVPAARSSGSVRHCITALLLREGKKKTTPPTKTTGISTSNLFSKIAGLQFKSTLPAKGGLVSMKNKSCVVYSSCWKNNPLATGKQSPALSGFPGGSGDGCS